MPTTPFYLSSFVSPSPRRHAVADAGLGEDVPGVVGVVAQLAAEPPHHVPHQPGLADLLRTPDPL